MIPILYDADITLAKMRHTNGLGRLSDAITCTVSEERNGGYELEMTYPMSGVHYDDIKYNRVIAAVPFSGGAKQAFRIYKLSRPIGGTVTIYARHISYDLSYIPCMPFDYVTGVAAVFEQLKTAAGADLGDFTFSTDIESTTKYHKEAPSSLKSTLGGVSGSVLDIFGGVFEWDNWTVKLNKSCGKQKNITLRYGKDLTDLTQEETIESMYTGCCPFWSKTQENGATQTVTLPEKIIESDYAANYPNPRIEMLDLSTYYDTIPKEATIRDIATKYVAAAKNYGVPQVSIKVSFVDLRNTEDYKSIAALEGVNLDDTISVKFVKLGVSTTAKVEKTTWNVLKDCYDSIELGEVKKGLADSVNSALAGLQGIQTTMGGTQTRKVYTNIYTKAPTSEGWDNPITISTWIRQVYYTDAEGETRQLYSKGAYHARIAVLKPNTVSNFYYSFCNVHLDVLSEYEDADGVKWPVVATNVNVYMYPPAVYHDAWPQSYDGDVTARFWKVDTKTGRLTELVENPLSLRAVLSYEIIDQMSLNDQGSIYNYLIWSLNSEGKYEYLKLDAITEYVQETPVEQTEYATTADLADYAKKADIPDVTDLTTKLGNILGIYAGSKVLTFAGSASCQLLSMDELNTLFNATDCSAGNTAIAISNGDFGAMGSSTFNAFYAQNAWHAHIGAAKTGLVRVNYIVVKFKK